ncbi:SH3 domain-containing protein [Aureivirga sp. CE67]|uniref:SH3 domain-containing protein n=1 Tax=Aureivirga sp. CE67 TaxID=1788983 RepID=UPI0018CA1A51|nr:SH3 domain-containing protein [Aureivirga sp. CE67]
MKKILIVLIIFCVNIVIAQEDKNFHIRGVVSNEKNLKEDSFVYLFGNNVKLREEPNTEASNKILDTLPMGAKLEIVDISTESFTYNGVAYPWVLVEYDYQVGYVCSGLIADHKVTSNGKDYFVFSGNFPNEKEPYTPKVKVRTKNSKDEVIENEIDLQIENVEYTFTWSNGSGINGVENILSIDTSVEACGYSSSSYIFLDDSNSFIKFKPLESYAGVGGGEDIDLIFPGDENGLKDYIIVSKNRNAIEEELSYDPENEVLIENTKDLKVKIPWRGISSVKDVNKVIEAEF